VFVLNREGHSVDIVLLSGRRYTVQTRDYRGKLSRVWFMCRGK